MFGNVSFSLWLLFFQGTTGFPWIDAIMRQLRTEGWIHNIARRAVASFLTRGCLWVNWEEGFKVSMRLGFPVPWNVTHVTSGEIQDAQVQTDFSKSENL